MAETRIRGPLPGREREDRAGRKALAPARPSRWEAAAWAGCAGVALVLAALTSLGPHRQWGLLAACGYGAAAVTALRARRNTGTLAAAVAVLGACVVPLFALVAAGTAQLEVDVVERSGRLLLETGSPYGTETGTGAAAGGAPRVEDINPYLPGMALFGLLPGDPRWWLTAAFVGPLVGSVLLMGGRRAPGGRAKALRPVVVTRLLWLPACPVVALPIAVGGVDLPVVALMVLAMVLAARIPVTRRSPGGRRREPPARRPISHRAGGGVVVVGIVLALAASLKWTAWPAVPVVCALVAARLGPWAAVRCAGVALGAAAALVLPFAAARPDAFRTQVVDFPLGLSTTGSPAASPLPGHLLAAYVPGGTAIALGLLVLCAAAVTASLWARPPRTLVAAADRLALGLALATALMPATRFGYLVCPLVLWALPRCGGRVSEAPPVSLLPPIPSIPCSAPPVPFLGEAVAHGPHTGRDQ